MKPWPYDSPGITDYLFTKDQTPITGEEIRAIVISKLRLTKSHLFLDIGAGTGAVAIEAGRIVSEGQVYAVEAVPERAALIEENRRKFGVANLQIITGTAPDALADLPQLDRVFIGGSNGKLAGILQQLTLKLRPEGRIVMTAVTLETLNIAINILSKSPYRDFEALAINLAELRKLNHYHLFQPEHAIYILTAAIGEENQLRIEN